MECAGFLHGFNKDVEVLYRSKLLRKFDNDCSKRLYKYLLDIGMNMTKGNPLKFTKNGEIIDVEMEVDG